MDGLSAMVSVRAGPTTAVVWASRTRDEPRELLAALARGGMTVVEVQSSFAALAEATRLESLRRRARPGETPPSPVVVLVHPETLEDPAALVDAVERYAPGAKCWMYVPAEPAPPGAGDAAAPPIAGKLRPVHIDDRVTNFRRPTPRAPRDAAPTITTTPASALPLTPIPVAPPAPNLRLAGDVPPLHPGWSEWAAQEADGEEDARRQAAGPAPRPLLTTEELRLLLDDAEER